MGPGKKVGVVGVGGLGHLAIQFAAALGAEVYVHVIVFIYFFVFPIHNRISCSL